MVQCAFQGTSWKLPGWELQADITTLCARSADTCAPDSAAPAAPAGGDTRIHFQAALHFPDTVSAAGLSAADFIVLRGPDPGPDLSTAASSADTGNGTLALAPGSEAEACACGVDFEAPPERPPTSSARSALR